VGYITAIDASYGQLAQELNILQGYVAAAGGSAAVAAAAAQDSTSPLAALQSLVSQVTSPLANPVANLPSTPVLPTAPTGTLTAPQGTIVIPAITLPAMYAAFPIQLSIDGMDVGAPPVTYSVAPGTHIVDIKVKGLPESRVSYYVPSGMTVTANIPTWGS
jgi:hypothetical protein